MSLRSIGSVGSSGGQSSRGTVGAFVWAEKEQRTRGEAFRDPLMSLEESGWGQRPPSSGKGGGEKTDRSSFSLSSFFFFLLSSYSYL